jgi:hypothetical protein
MIAKPLTNNEAHTLACELETQILKVLQGTVDYVAMTALTYATATLIVQLPTRGSTTDEQLDMFDGQLRTAVGLLKKHRMDAERHRRAMN